MIADDRLDAEGLSDACLHKVELGLGVRAEAIDRDDDRQSVFPHVGDMPLQIGEPSLQGGQILAAERVLRRAAMHLERANGGDDHRRVRLQPRDAALDVEELFRPEVRAKARFGDDIIGELERRARRDNRVAAMCDIGEGSAMHERGRAFERLNEIGLERVLEQRGHRAFGLEVASGDRRSVARVADDHPAEPRFEIVEVGGEAEGRHHFRGHGDVETVLARISVFRAAEADDDLAQGAIVHVERALPRDAARVEAERVAPVDVIVDHRREQVVGGSDRVKIAGEMQVDRVHRDDLRIAAAGGAAFQPEAGAERRLAQADDRLPAKAVEAVAETDRRGRLALAGRRRADRRHEDQLAVRAAGEAREEFRLELRDEAAVGIERGLRNADAGRDLRDRLQARGARDLDVGKHSPSSHRAPAQRGGP